MKYLAGKLIVLAGIAHTLVGIVLYAPQLWAFARTPFWFNVTPHSPTYPSNGMIADWPAEAGYWFLMSGFAWIVTGRLMIRMEQATGSLPAQLRRDLLLLFGVGAWTMPVSGFPVVALAALFIWWQGHKERVRHVPA